MMGTIAYQTGSGFEDTLTGINLKIKSITKMILILSLAMSLQIMMPKEQA